MSKIIQLKVRGVLAWGSESRIIPPSQKLTKKNLHFPQSLFPIGIFPMEPQPDQSL